MRNVYSIHKFDKSNYYKSLLTYVYVVFLVTGPVPDPFFDTGMKTTMRKLFDSSAYMHLF